jgi:hypothetical protein
LESKDFADTLPIDAGQHAALPRAMSNGLEAAIADERTGG